MKKRNSKRRWKRWVKGCGIGAAAAGLLMAVSGCAAKADHRGRAPFAWMEGAPRSKAGGEKMAEVKPKEEKEAGDLKPGDVVAFQMSQREAWQWIRQGKVQKVPYDLFRYGHLALVVPDPEGGKEWKLLQVAMGQAVQTDSGPEYLEGKEWRAFRPPAGAVDAERLRLFAKVSREAASDPKKSYDWWGVAGIRNAKYRAGEVEEIGERYTCTTLVVAALDFSGYSLNAVHREGWFDLVTPRQVVESRGKVRAAVSFAARGEGDRSGRKGE